MKAGRKNGFVKVSCDFLTEVMVSASEGRIPPDAVVSGVYYDATSDAFVFLISSAILGERKELEPLPLVTTLTEADLGQFFQGLTGRTWGKSLSKEEVATEAEQLLGREDVTDSEFRDLLRLIVRRFGKEPGK